MWKINILVRFYKNKFKQNFDFKIKTTTVKDHRLKFQIWDTEDSTKVSRKHTTKAHMALFSHILSLIPNHSIMLVNHLLKK